DVRAEPEARDEELLIGVEVRRRPDRPDDHVARPRLRLVFEDHRREGVLHDRAGPDESIAERAGSALVADEPREGGPAARPEPATRGLDDVRHLVVVEPEAECVREPGRRQRPIQEHEPRVVESGRLWARPEPADGLARDLLDGRTVGRLGHPGTAAAAKAAIEGKVASGWTSAGGVAPPPGLSWRRSIQ